MITTASPSQGHKVISAPRPLTPNKTCPRLAGDLTAGPSRSPIRLHLGITVDRNPFAAAWGRTPEPLGGEKPSAAFRCPASLNKCPISWDEHNASCYNVADRMLLGIHCCAPGSLFRFFFFHSHQNATLISSYVKISACMCENLWAVSTTHKFNKNTY